MARWRSGNASVCKTDMRGFDSRPCLQAKSLAKARRGGNRFPPAEFFKRPDGGMVYTHDLKSCLVRGVGSTPTPGTSLTNQQKQYS